MSDAQKEYGALLQSFVGETLSQVIYYEYRDPSNEVSFERFNKPFHDLHDGLDLIMKSSRILGITWGKQFAYFDIEVKEGALKYDERYPDHYAYNATNHDIWKQYINKQILNIASHWRQNIGIQESNSHIETDKYQWLPIVFRYLLDNVSNILPTTEDISSESTMTNYITYPQDIIVTLEDDAHLYISASMYEPNCDCFIPGMDNLTLIFDDKTANQYLQTLFGSSHK